MKQPWPSVLGSRFLEVIIFTLLHSQILPAQEINLRFQHITSDQGLSQNTVDCILKDSRGFIWFGTWNGLNRFDGYNFIVYKSDGQNKNLSNNFIYSLCEDKNGDIWAGTKNGLNKMIYSTHQFVKFFHNPKDNNTISGNRINVVYCDKKGTLWAGTDNGLDVIEPGPGYQNYRISHYRNTTGDPHSLPGNEVTALCEDRSGNLWVGTNGGLSKLNTKNKHITSIYRNNPQDTHTITFNSILSVYEDRTGIVWVGTEFGLNALNPATGVFTRFLHNPDDPKSLSHFTVTSIAEDNDGVLLVGTLGGLNRFNRNNNTFYKYPVNQNDDYSLNNEFINTIFPDLQGNVWIGTDKGGINKFNTYQKQFGYFIHNPANPNSLSNNTINSVLEEKSALWVGTAGGGLNKFDRATKTFTHYQYIPGQTTSLSNNYVTSLCRDSKNNLWIGTWGGGLNRMISANGIFREFITTSDPGSICNVFVSSLWPDNKGFLLIGTLSGLDLLVPEEKNFMHLANHPTWKHRIVEVGCILKDKKEFYWIGTRLGLYRFPSKKVRQLHDNDINHYTYMPDNPNSLPGNYVISLCEDHKGNIWAGTYGNGISKIEIKSGNAIKFGNYTEKDGLCNNVVYAVQEDGHGMLWLSTDNGLSRFDPEQKLFKNFYVNDGLQSNQFYWSAACKSYDGKMYFGGIKGLNFFYPDSIRDNTFKPQVAITDFKIFNNSVNIGLWNNKKVILEKSISETSRIYLSYKENVFSFEFSSLDYFLPEKVLYQYKMNGVDNDWVTVPASRRFVTYTNLKGGDYIFEVKACNSDGNWNNKSTKLQIHISPPFWATLWFKIVVAVFVSSLIVVYLRFRTKRLEAQKRVLEKLVKERTAKIEEQKEKLRSQSEQLLKSNAELAQRQKLIEGQKTQLERQNLEISEQRDKLIELNKHVKLVNQLKLRFFTNISHEFRTPLTLILGPLEKLITNWKNNDDTKNTLLLINRNAQRLLHLINQLMEFRKIETGKLELKVSNGDMVKFLENIFASFQHLALQRKIQYVFESGSCCREQWFDHEKIENVVYNLLSNAFKFTPENGRITLSVAEIKKELHQSDSGNKDTSVDSYIEIKVSDTGIGISQEHIHNIFKRFYQVNSSENLKVKGSGIGLSLTKELIKAHHGHISVESVKDKGSVFTVQVPFSKKSYTKNETIDVPVNFRENLQEQVSKLTEELLSEKPKTIQASEKTILNKQQSGQPLLLIAEDNYDLRSFISASLENEFRIIDTENGKEAYELAKIHNPELIISDIMMPGMDGLELCSRLKNNLLTSHITIILLTARSSVENWIEGFETGADDYIAKPFDINILIARVKNLIEAKRKLKKHFSAELAPDPSKVTSSPADEQFLKKALKIVEENFANPDFGVEVFVNKMCISHSLLHKKLSTITDQSAVDFITSVRLKKAAQLLFIPGKNISEIAYEVGFNDPKYFSRIFKKYFGKTPSEYGTMNPNEKSSI